MMNHTSQPGVEQVRATLQAQIKHIQGTLTREMRLSMSSCMEALRLLMVVEQLVDTARQEVPSFIARPHAKAFEKFKAAMLDKPRRVRRVRKIAA